MPRIVILGGGFGGVFAARHLERLLRKDAEIELICRNNFFVFQPLLAEVVGGSIRSADAVVPLRLLLPGIKVRVAEVRHIDFEAKTVHVTKGEGPQLTSVAYDQLIIGLGQIVDLDRVPGLADRALTMKNVLDAFRIRNHVIGCLEEADVAADPGRKRRLLSFVVIGGGFTGIETVGEMLELIRKSLKFYPNIGADDVRVVVVQHGNRILPELPDHLSRYATEALGRRGIEIVVNTGAKAVTPTSLQTDTGMEIEASTIIATIGNAPSPLVQNLPLPLQHGKIVVDRCMRVEGMRDVWALGDNALLPLTDEASAADEGAAAYAPPLAQFAVREAKILAGNVTASLRGQSPRPFVYKSLGTMAALGARRGVADIMGVKVSGFLAWVLWRTFYLGFLPGLANRIRVAADWTLDLIISRNIVQIRGEASESGYRHFAEGEQVILPGSDAPGLFAVISGTFEVRTTGEGPSPVRTVGPGGHFGLPFLGDERPTDIDARAVEDATVYFVDRTDLDRMVKISNLIGRGAVAPTREVEQHPKRSQSP